MKPCWLLPTVLICLATAVVEAGVETHSRPSDFLQGWLEGRAGFNSTGNLTLGDENTSIPSTLALSRRTPRPTPEIEPVADKLIANAWRGRYSLNVRFESTPEILFQAIGQPGFRAGALPKAEFSDLEWYRGNLYVLMKPPKASPTSMHLYRMTACPVGTVGPQQLAALAPPGAILEKLAVVEDRLFVIGREVGAESRRLFELRGIDGPHPGWYELGNVGSFESDAWDLQAGGETLVVYEHGARFVETAELPSAGARADWNRRRLEGGEWTEAMKELFFELDNRRDRSALVANRFRLPGPARIKSLEIESGSESLPKFRFRTAVSDESPYSEWSPPFRSANLPIEREGQFLQYEILQSADSDPATLASIRIEWESPFGIEVQGEPPTPNLAFSLKPGEGALGSKPSGRSPSGSVDDIRASDLKARGFSETGNLDANESGAKDSLIAALEGALQSEAAPSREDRTSERYRLPALDSRLRGNDGDRGDGLGNDGLGNDGVGNDGVGNDGVGNDGVGNDGDENDGDENDGDENDGDGNDGDGNDGDAGDLKSPVKGNESEAARPEASPDTEDDQVAQEDSEESSGGRNRSNESEQEPRSDAQGPERGAEPPSGTQGSKSAQNPSASPSMVNPAEVEASGLGPTHPGSPASTPGLGAPHPDMGKGSPRTRGGGKGVNSNAPVEGGITAGGAPSIGAGGNTEEGSGASASNGLRNPNKQPSNESESGDPFSPQASLTDAAEASGAAGSSTSGAGGPQPLEPPAHLATDSGQPSSSQASPHSPQPGPDGESGHSAGQGNGEQGNGEQGNGGQGNGGQGNGGQGNGGQGSGGQPSNRAQSAQGLPGFQDQFPESSAGAPSPRHSREGGNPGLGETPIAIAGGQAKEPPAFGQSSGTSTEALPKEGTPLIPHPGIEKKSAFLSRLSAKEGFPLLKTIAENNPSSRDLREPKDSVQKLKKETKPWWGWLIVFVLLLLAALLHRINQALPSRIGNTAPLAVPRFLHPEVWKRKKEDETSRANHRAAESVLEATEESERSLQTLSQSESFPRLDGKIIWQIAEPLPAPISPAAAFYKNGQVFVADPQGTICSAKITADGSLCPWGVRIGRLPRETSACGVAALDDFLVSQAKDHLHLARIDDEGIGEWRPVGRVPGIGGKPSLAGKGNRLYLAGGAGKNGNLPLVRSIDFDGNGRVVRIESQSPLPKGITDGSLAIGENRIYWVGGREDSAWTGNVFSAPLSPTGDLGEWRNETPLPLGMRKPTLQIWDRTLWVVAAGHQRSRVFAAPLASSGRLGEWTEIDSDLPEPLEGGACLRAGGRFLLVGGKNSNGASTPNREVFWWNTGPV